MESPFTAPDRIQWQRSSVQLCVLLIIVAFVVPRLALLTAASDGMSLSGDSKWYFDRAVSIAHGNGYAFDGTPTAFWPVGYPGFLALLFFPFPESLQTALIANFCLSAVTLACSFRIFQELHLSPGWAFFGTLILALFPNFIFYGNLILSEMLMTTLLSGSILLLLLARRNYQFLLTGICFGLATLVKSQVLFLPVFGFFFDFWNTRPGKAVIGRYLILAIGMSVIVLSWTLRNYAVFDRFILVQSNGGYNLLMGYNEANRWGGSVGASAELATLFPGVAADINQRLVDEIGMNDRATAVALRFISENPGEVLRRIPYKLYRFFRHDPQGIGSLVRSNADAGNRLAWLQQLFQFSDWYYTTVLALAMLSVIVLFLGPLRTRAHFILISTIFYFALISAVFFGEGRFHIPLLPAFVGCMLVTLHAVQARLRPSATPAAT